MKKIRVGVVFGGRSAEHEVSLQSAKNVLDALDREKYEPVLIGIDREGRWHLEEGTRLLFDAAPPLPKLDGDGSREVTLAVRGEGSRLITLSGSRESSMLDVIFPVLHGPYGEDGSIQGLCRLANLPCVGAGILGSAVGMDKDVMKRLLRDAGIATARFRAISRGKKPLSFDEASAELGSPVFIKPANMGSSVGVSRASTRAEYDAAVETALLYDTKVLVEERILGREIECSVLGNADPIASVPGEIETGAGHAFYDYRAKYIDENGAVLLIPASLEASVSEAVRRIAIRAFTALCCEGMARVDMFLRGSEELVVNEINTIPGFTHISMYPKLWEASGVSFGELVDRLIGLAIERHEVERGLKTTP
jgi:D-alanine-D-alanine ligase